jgi:hypothetical protein
MALDSKNNIKSVFIVPDKAASTAGTKITPGSLGAGFIAVCGLNNEILTAAEAAAANTIKIIKDRGINLPLQQVRISLSEVKTLNGVNGAAAREQIDYIGYDGVNTNTIQVASNNFYSVKLEHVPNAFAYGKRPANYKYGTFQSPDFGTGTIQNGTNAGIIASGLVASLIQNFVPNRTTDWRVFTELTNSGTRSAAGAAVNMTFTKYSRTVTVAGATATTNAVAGTYITLSTSKTLGVYRVASRTAGGVLTLDVPYQGETVTVAGNVAQIVTNANAIAGEWGIKITGIKQKYDVNRWRQYDKVRFNTFLDNFPNNSTPTIVTSTAALDGIGVYEQAANDEYISWGDEGQIFVDQTPPQFREQDAVVDTQYNPAILSWVNQLPSLIGAGENKGQAIFYIVNKDTANQGVTLVDRLAQFTSRSSSATFTWS